MEIIPLQYCFSGENIAVRARELYERSARSLAQRIELIPVTPLCGTLLTGQLAHQGQLLFSTVPSDKKRKNNSGVSSWCCEGCTFCDCGDCCDTASDGSEGCSGCDCSGCDNCCDCSGCDGCCCDCS